MQPKQNVVHLPVYKPGKSTADVKRELGLTEITKLSSNENPYGYSPKVKEAIAAEMDSISLYPDGAAVELTKVLADKLGVETNQVIFGMGSDEIILMIARAFLVPGDETIMATTTFPQYKHNAEIEGATIIEVPLIDGKHDLDGMLQAITDKTKIVWICNPNNPTGTMVTHDEVEAFLKAAPSHVLVVLDEAYCEYNVTDVYPRTFELLAAYKNAISLRTFSKIYGLASLRIGYAIGDPEVVHTINQVREPFNTTRFAQAAAIASLNDDEFIADCREKNAAGIVYLQGEFARLGLKAYPAFGNFIMVDVERPAVDVFQGMLKRGFIIRQDPEWKMPTCIRITIGSKEQNEKLIGALEAALADVALITK
ncbi:histidinol-phosphate transaminase [Paenibacillus albiflavus]|uniref:Histidinol-phosphate aminotransferase n=1 Tax=Paenibacillus albiflavus TaxID=2545760 RepID=A0A4R4ENL8_9BACL|nr:histidinol-phosphate transaminase [Paenibacillus albiflavus]TCZ81203.1 histidinol-phosphate transaminase [Paenibacillus albiflavus]